MNYPSQMIGKKHYFCCRRCMWDFASKDKNPEGYMKIKSLKGVSEHMKRLNRELNPTRMTPQVKEKLRHSRLGTGTGEYYEKTYGRHTHRVVAEQMLGRKLRPGEVVHHIDGDKRNNTPSNLMVFKNQAEHAAWHVKLNSFFGEEVMPT